MSSNPSIRMPKEILRSAWVRGLLAGLSGGLLVLVFPKFNLSGLAWIALVPLLIAVTGARRARGAFALGIVAGTVEFAGMLAWIPYPLIHYGNLPPALAIGVQGLLAVFLALFVGLFGLLLFWAYRYSRRWALALAPCAWVVSELARNYLAVNGFPWCLLGYSQAPRLELMQIADTTGIYGVSFLIALINAVVAAWILRGMGRSRDLRMVIMLSCSAIILCSLCGAYGLISAYKILIPESRNEGGKIFVACIQGNVPITDTLEPYREKFYRSYPRMIKNAADSGPRLIVLPESPTPFYFQTDMGFRAHMTNLAKQNNVWLLFNNTSHDPIEDNEAYFNSVYLLSPTGELASRYDKTHLVPFGEYVPLKRVLKFAGKVLSEISDFHPGSQPIISDIGSAKFGTFICFEALFPEWVREFPRQGAQFLINITNDAWYGESAAPYQHLAMVRVRAIENRRYLVRATNSGISAIIDPYGRLVQSTELFKEAILSGEVRARNDLTFYTQFGDVFAWICVIIAVGAPLYGYFKGGEKSYD